MLGLYIIDSVVLTIRAHTSVYIASRTALNVPAVVSTPRWVFVTLPYHLILVSVPIFADSHYIPAHIAILNASAASLSAFINPAAFQKSIG